MYEGQSFKGKVSGKTAQDQTFMHKTKEITVFHYFQVLKGKTDIMPMGKLLVVENRQGKISYFPVQYCFEMLDLMYGLKT